MDKVSRVSNGQPEPVSQADWHHWEWWKGLGSHVAADKTIRDRCGVYSGDCRQEVTPWQDIREHSTEIMRSEPLSCSQCSEVSSECCAVSSAWLVWKVLPFTKPQLHELYFMRKCVIHVFLCSLLRSVNSSQMFALASLSFFVCFVFWSLFRR